jgi:AbrB family looped-hinge helix DNA binding protein
MTSLTVTAKGQVTLKKELLAHLGSRPGDRLAVEKLPDGRIEVRAMRATGRIDDAFGLLKRESGPHLSIEQMNDIAADGWAKTR